MRGWLKKLVDQYLPAVESLSHSEPDRATAIALANQMRQAWSEHGMTTLKQQKNLMIEVRSAIKQRLGADHIAVETMNFTSEEWTEVNRSSAQVVAMQNQNQVILHPNTVNAIVSRATNLLLSRDWSDIAAGLVVLTGRRSTEIIKTAEFTKQSEYSVTFTGALKRKGEAVILSFEIPSLCQADYIISAYSKLRKILPASQLSNTEVNQKYADDVAKACDRHFADIVPPAAGKENLYTHLFRKIYATIATYYYCPPNVDEAEYRAQIQGHFSGHEHLSQAERRSIASDRHYRSYVIADEEGNMRKGIKLGWQGVEIIEAFRADQDGQTKSDLFNQTEGQDNMAKQASSSSTNKALPNQTTEAKTISQNNPKRKRSSLRTYADEHDRWVIVLNQICPDCPTQPEKTSALLSWVESKLKPENVELDRPDASSNDGEPSATTTTTDISIIANQAHTLAWLTREIESLRVRVSQLEEENQTLKTQTEETAHNSESDRLKEENALLTQQRDEAVSKLEAFRALLNGNSGATNPSLTTSSSTTKAAVPYSPNLATSPAIAETKSTATKPRKPAHISTDEQGLDENVLRALNALIQYNDAQSNHTDKWAISFPSIKDLCKQLGVSTQSKIDDVFKAKADLIEEHHRNHGLGQRHNRVHKGQNISDVIKL